MLNSKLVRAAISATVLITVAPLAAADDSSWLDGQLAASDGNPQTYEAPKAGPESRRGNVYVGANLETSQEDFVQRGMRITDGTPE